MRIEVNDGYSQVAGFITWKRLANELFRRGGELKSDEQVITFEICRRGINYFVAKRPIEDEVARIMNMSEAELAAELAKDGGTIESAAACGRAAFERAKAEVDMTKLIRAWLKCPAEKRPSPEALGNTIAGRAVDFCAPASPSPTTSAQVRP